MCVCHPPSLPSSLSSEKHKFSKPNYNFSSWPFLCRSRYFFLSQTRWRPCRPPPPSAGCACFGRADRLGFAQILGVDQFHPAAGIQNRRFDRLYAGLADAVAQVDALTRDDPSPPPM